MQSQQDNLISLKVGIILIIVMQVIVFGNLISQSTCFRGRTCMSTALTFSGTLFISIALVHILPEAFSSISKAIYQEYNQPVRTNLISGSVPIASIICVLTFLVILLIDKILITHPHEDIDNQPLPAQQLLQQRDSSEKNESHSNLQALILQVGLSIHAFFQLMAVGIQKSKFSLLGLAVAIIVHKWSEGLTLGLLLRKEGYGKVTIFFMILFQAMVNIAGMAIGCILAEMGPLVGGIFSSIASGTFIFISLVQILPEQLAQPTKLKLMAMLGANMFIAGVTLLEIYQQQLFESQSHG